MSAAVAAAAWILLLSVAAQVHHAGAQTADCTARFGPGCQQCENITESSGYGSPSPGPGGDRWGNSWGGQRWGGRRLMHGGRDGGGGGSGDGGWRDGWGSYNRTRLVCLACSTGYKLSTRQNRTYGACKCATGWGVVPLNSSSSSSQWWDHGRGSYECVDCSLENKVIALPAALCVC